MYEDVIYDDILSRMLNRVPDKFDKREGSVIFDSLSPTAIELQILYLELDTILRDAYGDTASREFLIKRCAERGIVPKGATNARLKGEFTPATVDIPIGSKFNIDKLNYEVIEKMEDGKYQLKCELVGSIGNQYTGQMIPMEYIQGLEKAELTEVLIPGEDDEGTEELRGRYFESFDSKAFGGNRKDYIEKTNAIPGVGCTKVTPVWNGDICPSSMIPNESVSDWYHSVIDGLDDNVAKWLSSVYKAADEKKLTVGGTVRLTIIDSNFNKASDTLIHNVQSEIDPSDKTGEGLGTAPIGHVVKVDSVTNVDINITTKLVFEQGYSWSNLQSSINEVIEDYLLELRKTWADSSYIILRISQIETRLLKIGGILDVSETKINGFEGNLNLAALEIPVFGGVSE